MKLTYALIVAMLFLTACQLITTYNPRRRQVYRVARERTPEQEIVFENASNGKCDPPGAACTRVNNNCCKICTLRKTGDPVCTRQ
uniref:Conotoxin n=1 Tax=Conus praecellens TaxID=128530 RepID=A0A291C2K9_CONPC|nr:conotoxin [Conus praecellens]